MECRCPLHLRTGETLGLAGPLSGTYCELGTAKPHAIDFHQYDISGVTSQLRTELVIFCVSTFIGQGACHAPRSSIKTGHLFVLHCAHDHTHRRLTCIAEAGAEPTRPALNCADRSRRHGHGDDWNGGWWSWSWARVSWLAPGWHRTLG